MDLTTTFMGVKLSAPIIAGACDMTDKPRLVSKLEDAGAGAVVIKSLFEEQIQLEQYKWDEENVQYDALHPMMETVGPHVHHPGPDEHLHKIQKIKEQTSIPVIASLNALTRETWLEYAYRLEQTGVDGLEVNLYASPRESVYTSDAVEEAQLTLLKELKKTLTIPVCAKLSAFYTNPLNFITRVGEQGIDGVVLFNRLFQPDIDAEKEEPTFPFNLSESVDNRLPLRFTGLLYNRTPASLCASTGVHDAVDVAKMLLAGADCVQVVSTLYKHGIGQLEQIVTGLRSWMEKKGYASLEEFRGKMSRENSSDRWLYTRAQYVNLLMRGNPLDT